MSDPDLPTIPPTDPTPQLDVEPAETPDPVVKFEPEWLDRGVPPDDEETR